MPCIISVLRKPYCLAVDFFPCERAKWQVLACRNLELTWSKIYSPLPYHKKLENTISFISELLKLLFIEFCLVTTHKYIFDEICKNDLRLLWLNLFPINLYFILRLILLVS